jgi:hypothetical protein
MFGCFLMPIQSLTPINALNSLSSTSHQSLYPPFGFLPSSSCAYLLVSIHMRRKIVCVQNNPNRYKKVGILVYSCFKPDGPPNTAMVLEKMCYYFVTMSLHEINVECYLDPKVPLVVHFHYHPQKCHFCHPLFPHAPHKYHLRHQFRIVINWVPITVTPLFMFYWNLLYREYS